MAGAVFGEVGLTLVAPRIVNDVSYVRTIKQESRRNIWWSHFL